MQLSLFDDEIKTVEKKDCFYYTYGLMKEFLKYGKEDNTMPYTNKVEDRNDIINVLLKNNYSRKDAEELIDKVCSNTDTWYCYKESFYIF